MGLSYKESSEEYKNNKKKIVDGYEKAPYKKIKNKKNKRSNHKHEYVPAIYKRDNENFQTCGKHCKICGRVQDMYFFWKTSEELESFKKNNPDYLEVILPVGWDYFKDKKIPV